MGYAAAFQPILGLLGQRAEAQRAQGLLEAANKREAERLAEQRKYEGGLLARQEKAAAEARARDDLKNGLRPYTPGLLSYDDQKQVTGVKAWDANPAQVASPVGLLGRALAPALEQRAAASAADIAERTGGWIKAAASEADLAREDQQKARAEELAARLEAQREAAAAAAAAAADQKQRDRELRREIATGQQATARAIAEARQGTLKRIPESTAGKMRENDMLLGRIDEAIAALEQNPKAVGMSNVGPGEWFKNQTGDTDENMRTRALIGDLGSQLIHDRSGAAVSVSEFPRLRAFVPQTTNSYRDVMTKLTAMRRAAQEEAESFQANYNEEQGFRPYVSPRAARTADREEQSDRKPAAAAGGVKRTAKAAAGPVRNPYR